MAPKIFSTIVLILPLLAGLAVGHEARAETPMPAFSVRGTETLIGEFVGDNGPANEATQGEDDNFFLLRNILWLQAGNGTLDTDLKLDGNFFAGPPAHVGVAGYVPGGTGYTTLDYDNDLRLERISGRYRNDELEVTAGDFYVTLGRGIALSLIKLDDAGVDNTLRGARFDWHRPGTGRLTVFGGVTNALNTDPLTHAILRTDPLDRIAGARAEWEILDALSLGVHGVVLRPRFTSEAEVPIEHLQVDAGPGVSATSGGLSAELNAAGFHLYLEGNAQTHDDYRPPTASADLRDERGLAFFGELGYDLPPISLKLEGLAYDRWLVEGPRRGSSYNLAQPIVYNHMPTLEPQWMIIKSFGNARGGRLSGDVFLAGSDTQLTLALTAIQYLGGLLPQGEWSDHPPTLVLHPQLKVRQDLGSSGAHLGAAGGFRHEEATESRPGGAASGYLWHAALDASVPLSGTQSLEGKVELRRHALTVTEDLDYWVTLTSLGWEMSGLAGLTLVHEYSDATPGVEAAFGDVELPLPRQHYLWAMANLHLPAPLESLTLRLLGGSQRGGIKCAGGVCRNYPDAVGARLEAVYRF